MTNTEQAHEIYSIFYRIIAASVNEDEIDVSTIAKNCAISAIKMRDTCEHDNILIQELENNY